MGAHINGKKSNSLHARDLFSAVSVANPSNDDNGGIYIARALKLIEDDIVKAAERLPDSLFVEFWGESVPKEKRISRWLEKADAFASEWKPSEMLSPGRKPENHAERK